MEIGDRIKLYESLYDPIAMPRVPLMLRCDGRSFHTYLKKAQKPFDHNVVHIMDEVTKFLVKETNAVIGYTQSDEITLILFQENYKSSTLFNGRINKLNSVVAALATAKFSQLVPTYLPDNKGLPVFDCRTFSVPSKDEAVNVLVWRELDAVRNSILSVGQANFSHKEMQGIKCDELQEKLFQERGINWNNFEPRLKRGGYFRRIVEERLATEAEKALQKGKASGTIIRHRIDNVVYPQLTKVENKVEVIFENASPILKEIV